MKRYKIAIGFAQLLLISVPGCGEDTTSVPTPKYSALSDSSFTVGEAGSIDVVGFAGKVSVVSGDPGIVRVAVKKWAGQPEHLDQMEVPPDTRPSLDLGAGEISYEGPAEGDCQFGLGAGSIALRLPDDVNVAVHISVGAGSIHVAFPVVGQMNEHLVDGIIGTGVDGSIVAGVGAGQIVVARQ